MNGKEFKETNLIRKKKLKPYNQIFTNKQKNKQLFSR